MAFTNNIRGKTLKKISYVPVLCAIAVLLVSCDPKSNMEIPKQPLLRGVSAKDLTARILLRKSDSKGDRVQIVIQNPAGERIRSARAWIKFDPEKVKVNEFSLDDGRFLLFAPGEKGIDNAEGFLKFGGAVTTPVTDAEIALASFTVKKSDGEAPMFVFYDWRADGGGHTAVLTVKNNSPINIVSSPLPLSL